MKKFISRFKPERNIDRAPVRIPEGQRVYAIGDVHGRLDLLEQLIGLLIIDQANRPTRDTVFLFLGDLIDRGPSSAAVIDRLIRFSEGRRTRFIRGNHEEIFLQLLEGRAEVARMFTKIGGRETALSYGISERDYNACDFPDLADLLRRYVPHRHRIFFEAMEEMIIIGDYAFVHAGIEPDRALCDQDMRKTRWIREEFTSAAGPFEKVIVHGHSITCQIDQHDHRIGLDTGAFRSGRLSAMGFEGDRTWIVQACSEKEARGKQRDESP